MPTTITIDWGIVTTIGMTVFAVINGWIIYMFKELSGDVRDIRREQQQAVLASMTLSVAMKDNTRLTEEAIVQARAAYAEANTVNKKLEALGHKTLEGVH